MKQLKTIVNMFARLKVLSLILGISERSLQQVKIVYIFWNMNGPTLYENAKSLLATLFSIRNTYLLSDDAKPEWRNLSAQPTILICK